MMEAYWFGHINMKYVTAVKIDEESGGKIAYLTAVDRVNGGEITVRASIVAKQRDVRFTVWDCYTTVLSEFWRSNDHEIYGGSAENSRSNYNKLVIVGNERNPDNRYLSFEVAVVIEKVDPENPIDVGYEFTPMAEWTTYADTRVTIDAEKETTVNVRRRTSQVTNIRSGAALIAGLQSPYTKNLDTLYETLCTIIFTRKYVSDDRILSMGQEFEEALYACEDYIAEYEAHFENGYLAIMQSQYMAQRLFGMA
jgi:hypothetical protein